MPYFENCLNNGSGSFLFQFLIDTLFLSYERYEAICSYERICPLRALVGHDARKVLIGRVFHLKRLKLLLYINKYLHVIAI